MTAVDCAVMPLVSQIEELVANVDGWSPVDELFTLSLLAHATSGLPGDLVEIGSWLGRSSLVLGAAARDTHGVVHCIDLFPDRDDWRMNADGSYSFEVEIDGRRQGGYQEQTVWRRPFEGQIAPVYARRPSLLDAFYENVRARALEAFVRPHRGTASTFVDQAPAGFRCRLIFLDGDHGYQAVRDDIAALTPFLVPGGWLCFDDAFSCYDGVDRAIRELVLDNPAYDVKRQMTRKCFVARRAACA
jgi:methyltransferase family protein